MTAPSDPTAGMEPIRQIAMEMMRRCGTCRWWERSALSHGLGYCEWPRLHLPASIATRPVMHKNKGTDCAMWRDRAEAALREAGE